MKRSFQKAFANRLFLKKGLSAVLAIALLWATVTTAAISFPSVAVADSTPASTSPAPAAQLDSNDIAADKVDKFAQAYLQVLQLLSDREPELPAAQTSDEALKVQASIEAEALTLIENSGLTLPEYMDMLSVASQDTTFRDKVLGSMDESLGQ